MADTKISAAADVGTVNGTDMFPLARSGSTSAYHATATELAAFAAAHAALATTSAVGVVKPDGVSVLVDVDGTIHAPPNADVVYYAVNFPSLQAAHDAMPATGGELVLAAGTTYTLSATLNITKPNVVLRGHGASSVIQRNNTLNAPLINVGGDNCVVRDLAINGNGVTNTANLFAELQLSGQFCTGERLRVSNSRAVHVALQGAYSSLRRSRIVGMNDGTGTIQAYGVWAINHVTVYVRDNTITDCGIDGIGVDGNGTQVVGNYLSNNHSYTGIGGGQIATYGANANSVGIVIANNTIDAGAGPTSHGIEIDTKAALVVGNSIRNQKWNGIAFDAIGSSSCTIVGNTIINSGQAQASNAAIALAAGVSDLVITGNTLADLQGTPTQQYGVMIPAGASNNYTVKNNLFLNNTAGQISDGGTGTKKDLIGPRLLYWDTSSSGNGADLTMDVMKTFTVPAGTLNTVGDRLVFRAGGTFAGNTNVKNVQLQWATTAIGSNLSVSAAGQVFWRLEGEILLTASGAQTWSFTFSSNNNVVVSNTSAGLRGNTAPQPLAIAGQNTTAATANSVTCTYFTIEYVPVANT